MSKSVLRLLVAAALLFVAGIGAVSAQEAAAEPAPAGRSPLAVGLIAVAAALAVGICAIGTAIAQSRIGAAGAGTIAERPDTSGTIILLVAIPETMVILGFVIAIVMLFTL
jgi:V/A-type H+-transporting ATPase subunit K